jgi:serine/threonine protein kinase
LYRLTKAAPRGIEYGFARRFFSQIALAVEFLHVCKRIAHLDLSLENIFIFDDDVEDKKDLSDGCVAKLGDFGQAQDLNALGLCVLRSARPGKPPYLSPELVALGPVTSKTIGLPFDGRALDVWALGVCLFTMLTGHPPFATAAPTDARFRMMVMGEKVLSATGGTTSGGGGGTGTAGSAGSGDGGSGIARLLRLWKYDEQQCPAVAIDLLSHMLCPIDRRWDIGRVLRHPFVEDKCRPAGGSPAPSRQPQKQQQQQ